MWVRTCSLRLLLRANFLPQVSHTYGLSPVCDLAWTSMADRLEKTLGQCGHLTLVQAFLTGPAGAGPAVGAGGALLGVVEAEAAGFFLPPRLAADIRNFSMGCLPSASADHEINF